ncbi:hypothetical protein CW747_02485 [Staphylococcus shinii]|uniref:DUF3310 domain-containing protein n=1 Tax=Staphylococcus shinii TaxID=2912228 RepID=UPI000C325F31|nr:DUF3310 domain-containing protein [Staphylococcus shinii]PKI11024.1 hypothetical protein CW747_02485 [Staphylococcus shinii]
MKIRDLNLDDHVIVYDLGKSENSEGREVVGRVIGLERSYVPSLAVIQTDNGIHYNINNNNYFDLWSNHIESKTESVSESFNSRLRKNIEAQNEYLNSLVKPEQSNDVQQRKRNDTVNHPSHYNYGEIEVIDFIEQVTKHYNPNVAYHIGNAIKYLACSPHKNGKEDIQKAKWYIERAFENWDVK